MQKEKSKTPHRVSKAKRSTTTPASLERLVKESFRQTYGKVCKWSDCNRTEACAALSCGVE